MSGRLMAAVALLVMAGIPNVMQAGDRAAATGTSARPGNATPDRVVAAAKDGGRAATFARHIAEEFGGRLTGSKSLALAEEWARDEFERMGLENVRLEEWGEYKVKKGRAEASSRGVAVHNIVGEIRGGVRPEEIVLLGAHLDSVDLAAGATDNAAGCGAVMEAARALRASGIRPARTIRFVLFTGEEQGLLGAQAYVDAHEGELDRTSVFLNMDAGTSPITGLAVTEEMQPHLAGALAALSGLDTSRPFNLATAASSQPSSDCCGGSTGCCASGKHQHSSSHCTRSTKDAAHSSTKPACATSRASSPKSCSVKNGGGACASDHTAFLRAGVPAFLFEQEGGNYERTHHTELDTADALDGEAIQHSAVVMAVAALGVADLPGMLPRTHPVKTAQPSDGRTAASGHRPACAM